MSHETCVSLTKAAGILGVHPSTLRAWADKGEVSSARTAGGHRRFRVADLHSWQAARQQSNLPRANIVVQSALGRARLDLVEGRLNTEPWYSRLDLDARQRHRQLGRRLLALLITYLADPGQGAEAVEGARAVGREYEQLGRESGVTAAERVRAFLFFRGYLHQSVFEAWNASAAGSDTLHAWQALQSRIEYFTDEALLALVDAAEAGA
jgi:excisionase family DNA binding protein